MSNQDLTNELLNLSVTAGADVDASNPERISSEAYKKRFDEAKKDLTSSRIDLVDRLKECLQVLQASETDNSITVDDVAATMRRITSICGDVGLACDFHKIGGCSIVIKFLNHTDINLRYGAVDIFVVLSQANKYSKNMLLKEFNVLQMLLGMTLKHDSDLEKILATRSMYAVFYMLLNNPTGIEPFLACDGCAYLLKGIYSQVPNLRVQSVFVLSNLIKENKGTHTALNPDTYVASLLAALPIENDFDVIKFTLDALLNLYIPNADFRNKCKENSKEFKFAIESLLSNESVKSDRQDIIDKCNYLYKLLNLKNFTHA